MPRIYTINFDAVSVSAAVDLLEITPADDKPIQLVSVVGAVSDSETNEQFRVTVKRASGAFSSGSGGGTPTTGKTNNLDPSAGFTAERTNSTRVTGGTTDVLHSEGFPSQGGFNITPLPGAEFGASQGEALLVGLENAPGSATTFSVTAYVREFP